VNGWGVKGASVKRGSTVQILLLKHNGFLRFDGDIQLYRIKCAGIVKREFYGVDYIDEEGLESPPFTNDADNGEPYWVRYFRLRLGVAADAPVSVTQDKNYYRVHADNQDFFLKEYSGVEEWRGEVVINSYLYKWSQGKNTDPVTGRPVSSVLLLALFGFQARKLSADGDRVYFIVFEHQPVIKISDLSTSHAGVEIPAAVFGDGLRSILLFYIYTSPNLPWGPTSVRFWHRDLHGGQILYITDQNRFVLCDFGNSHLEAFAAPPTVIKICNSKSSSPRTEEVQNIISLFRAALNGQAPTPAIEILKGRMDKLSTETRNQYISEKHIPALNALLDL